MLGWANIERVKLGGRARGVQRYRGCILGGAREGESLALIVDDGVCHRQLRTTPLRRVEQKGPILFCETDGSIYRIELEDALTDLDVRMFRDEQLEKLPLAKLETAARVHDILTRFGRAVRRVVA